VKEAAVLDLLIRDASIVDDTGAAARHGDVGDGVMPGTVCGRDATRRRETNVSVVRAETSPCRAE
jgi:hypothetical protein